MMEKLVFVVNRLGGGGAERVLTLLANHFKQSGHDVYIITLNRYTKSYENLCPFYELQYDSNLKQLKALRLKIKELSPNAIIAFEYFVAMKTVLATFGLNARVIVSERNNPHKLDKQPLKRILRDFLYSCADVIVCQTDDAKAYFPKRIRKKTVVILNPIMESLPNWKWENHNKTIINFCRLEKQKNIPILLKAFQLVYEKHPDYSLAIYGEGSEEQHIRELIHKMLLEECVTLEPFNSNIHEIASKCTMFVSSSDYEGLSNSMLEAMAMGMPVICTDCPIGGAKMIIKNGINGIMVPIKNHIALAERINFLIENPNKLQEIGNEAYKIRKLLSLNTIASHWMSIIQKKRI